jgi:hypothetical protein
MDKIIAYCGLVCTDCPAYVATQADDRTALEQVVVQWREAYNAPHMTVEYVICDGCLSDEGRRCGHCAECEIRACGVGRGVVNCAHCPDYVCARLENFFGFVPDARTVLDGVRRTLR